MSEKFDQRTGALLEALRDVLCRVAPPDAALSAILRTSVEATGADRGLLVEVEGRDRPGFRVLHNISGRQYEGPGGDFSRHLFTQVLETGEDVVLRTATDHPFYERAGSIQAIGTSAVLCVPIRAGNRIAAIVHLEKRQVGSFHDELRAMLHSLFAVAGGVLDSLAASRASTSAEGELHEELSREWSFGRFLGRSPAVRQLERDLRAAAGHEAPALLLGETGTGKSILARAIHAESPRAKKACVTVFCPSLEKGMVESELFGHRRGAFTDARTDRVGKVQAAEGGTLFFDEIGDMPLDIQAKLLRLLEERTYEMLGDTTERIANVRIIAATHRDLEAEVRNGRFRDDLLARLDMIQVRVPPLRERVEDIGLLLRDSLDREPGGRWITLAPEAVAYLEALPFTWPHNVRHLTRLATRLALVKPDSPVTPDLVAGILDKREQVHSTSASGKLPLEAGLPALLAEAECEWLQEARTRYPKLTRAELAVKLKISESTLYKKLADCRLGDP